MIRSPDGSEFPKTIKNKIKNLNGIQDEENQKN